MQSLRAKIASLESQPNKKREQVLEIILALAFMAGPFGFSVPIFYSCISWAVAWIALIHFIWHMEYFAGVTARRKAVFAEISTVILVLIIYAPIHGAYVKEKAIALSGDLVAEDDGQDHSSDLPVLQFGNTRFTWAGTPGKPSFTHDTPDFSDRLSIEMVNGRVQLSTTVRAKDGELIVQIINNHWTVSSSKAVCWDKNYSKDRLEVKDGKGRVVLQVRELPNVVQLQVEWDENMGKGGGIFVDGLYSSREGITPVFKYPSDLYWGELGRERN